MVLLEKKQITLEFSVYNQRHENAFMEKPTLLVNFITVRN